LISLKRHQGGQAGWPARRISRKHQSTRTPNPAWEGALQGCRGSHDQTCFHCSIAAFPFRLQFFSPGHSQVELQNINSTAYHYQSSRNPDTAVSYDSLSVCPSRWLTLPSASRQQPTNALPATDAVQLLPTTAILSRPTSTLVAMLHWMHSGLPSPSPTILMSRRRIGLAG
jgi:hypothetical protein